MFTHDYGLAGDGSAVVVPPMRVQPAPAASSAGACCRNSNRSVPRTGTTASAPHHGAADPLPLPTSGHQPQLALERACLAPALRPLVP